MNTVQVDLHRVTSLIDKAQNLSGWDWLMIALVTAGASLLTYFGTMLARFAARTAWRTTKASGRAVAWCFSSRRSDYCQDLVATVEKADEWDAEKRLLRCGDLLLTLRSDCVIEKAELNGELGDPRRFLSDKEKTHLDCAAKKVIAEIEKARAENAKSCIRGRLAHRDHANKPDTGAPAHNRLAAHLNRRS